MNKDGLLITIVDECLQKAREMHIETMDEFSQWLIFKGWMRNEYGFWYNENNIEEVYKFSKLYQLFLKSKEA